MSVKIEWSDEFKLGIKEIDNQHEELFSHVNLLLTANNNDENREQIEAFIEFLRAYIVEHFGAEEHLQRQYKYPNYHDHRKEHFEFVKFVGGLAQKYNATRSCTDSETCTTLIDQINLQLVDWITHHIGESDRAVAEHILSVHVPNKPHNLL